MRNETKAKNATATNKRAKPIRVGVTTSVMDLHQKAIVVDGHVHITNSVFKQGIDPWVEQTTGAFDYSRARTIGFSEFEDKWQANARLALDTIAMRPTQGIPSWVLNDMQWSHLETLSGNPPGSYEKDPVRVYREFQLKIGTCFIDQWIPDNPLSMKDQGYESNTQRGATTGAEEIILDGKNMKTLIEGLKYYRELGRG